MSNKAKEHKMCFGFSWWFFLHSVAGHITCIVFLYDVSDSYPAFFLLIATTSNKNFLKCRNCKCEDSGHPSDSAPFEPAVECGYSMYICVF